MRSPPGPARRPAGSPEPRAGDGTGLIFARQVASATGLTGGRMYLYVDDMDAHHAAARAAGADASTPDDAPWGDRIYNTRDLQGHPWTFASPVARPAPAPV